MIAGNTHIRQWRRREGYVLVISVMLLAVTVLIVAGIARHSMALATSAKQGEQILRHKWAVASAQRFYLKNGERFLTTIDRSQLQLDIKLSGLEIRNIISDESTKLDINAMAALVSNEELAKVARRYASEQDLIIRLRPMSNNQNESHRNPYEAWGQVFESRGQNVGEGLGSIAQKLTLWGSRLNFRKADEQVLRNAIKSAAGSIMADRFVEAMNDNPSASLSQLLAAADANDRQARILNRLLTDRSWATSVHSMVLDENKVSNHFVVQQRPVENISRYQSFKW